jgi:16S rRNA (guanine527-N7)-methyltransferase
MFTEKEARLLSEGARLLGIQLPADAARRFDIYLEELQLWSRIVSLVSRTEPEVVIRKHILDSLAVSPLIPPGSRLIDLGSGAGFPGLVLAIARPALEVVLVEARRKKVSFLKEVLRKTGAANAGVCEGRAEALAKEKSLRASFGIVISRATWDLERFLRLASPFVSSGGVILAMKGPQVDTELLGLDKKRLQNSGFCLKEKHAYTLPLGGEKRVVIAFTRHVSRDT